MAKRIVFWHLNVKVTGSNPYTTAGQPQMVALCWPRPPHLKNDVHFRFVRITSHLAPLRLFWVVEFGAVDLDSRH